MDQGTRGVKAGIQIHRADDGLQGIRQDGGARILPARPQLTLTQAQMGRQAKVKRQLVQGILACTSFARTRERSPSGRL
jgi:hypothetical protein